MLIEYFILLFIFNSGWIEAEAFSSNAPCLVPRIAHGRPRLKQRRSNLVKFVCSARYELVGNTYATCINGRWDVPAPVCVRTGCDLPLITNGLVLPSRRGAWVTFFCLPQYELVGPPALFCDGKQWNDTAPTCVDSKAQVALSCDFEDPGLCGWRQDELHDFDWDRRNKKTPSYILSTGPAYDHTYGPGGSGHYMYIESSSRLTNETARLLSPIYDSSVARNSCFSFYYHMYGASCGGLRVFQKPDSVDLYRGLLQIPAQERTRYLLFEKWGNLGDVWYSSVHSLSDFSEDFQIVIEGIRGEDYTSDIAIDDVAILNGDDCVAAMKNVHTPPPPPQLQSCAGRCQDTDESGSCGCTFICLMQRNCCPDVLDVCFLDFNTDSTPSDNSPQTQKLVFTFPEPTSPTTTSTFRTTKSTTTRKPTTTTVKTTESTRTTKTKTMRTTPKTTRTTPVTKPTTTSTTTKRTATRPSTITIKTTTSTRATTMNSEVHKEMIDKEKRIHEIEDKKDKKPVTIPIKKENDKPSSSGWTTFYVIMVLALCVGATLSLVVLARSVRGRIAIARLRGRVTRDQEVRFLSTDVDDD